MSHKYLKEKKIQRPLFSLLFIPSEKKIAQVMWKMFGGVWVHYVDVRLTTGKLMKREEFCLQLKTPLPVGHLIGIAGKSQASQPLCQQFLGSYGTSVLAAGRE